MISVLAFCIAAQCLAAPPARYDHRYTGLLDVYHVKQSEVAKRCKINVFSCAVRTEGFPSCKIYLSTRIRKHSLKAIMRHEIAHCNGWGTPQNQHPR